MYTVRYMPVALRGLIILTILMASHGISIGQGSVYGTVVDSTSGEVLIGATLFSPLTAKGYTTNSYGFFTIPGVADSVHLRVSYMGYQTSSVCLSPSDGVVTIRLAPASTYLEGVEVRRTSSRSPTHGQHTISMMDLRNTPVLMAEKDVLKTIQLLPGVLQNSEGGSSFSVRGGSHDQNLMLIDGIPVYNINHLWGFVSVFNTDAVNSVNFYKGGIPASYGGRLSSVVDVMLREGNREQFTGSVSAGLISSRFTFEGPIQKGRSSFLVSGRRTMYDLIVSPVIQAVQGVKPGYYFQDYSVKFNHQLTPNNTIYLSSYFGNDRAYIKERDENPYTGEVNSQSYNFGWGNFTTALRWNNSSLPNVFSNVTLAYTQFRYLTSYQTRVEFPDASGDRLDYMGYYSGIRDLIARWSLSYYEIDNHQLYAGVEHTWHKFNPGVNRVSYKDSLPSDNLVVGHDDITYTQELNAYIDDRFRYGWLSGSVGVRYTMYTVGQNQFHDLQPRAVLEVKASQRISVFAGYNRMVQHVQLVTNTNMAMPTDLWLPISGWMPPQRADQLSVGINYEFTHRYKLTVEAFSKSMRNLTDFRNAEMLHSTEELIHGQTTNWERLLTLGDGHSRGIEVMLDREHGTITGWLSYSLSKTDRTYSEINRGQPFPFQYDRRHAANLFIAYQLSPSRSLSASWVASSGSWLTVSAGNFNIGRNELMDLGSRNNFQTPSFHHLDITYSSSKEKRRGTRSWIFGVYNVYANHNPFFITHSNPIDGIEFDPNRLYSFSIFPIIPFVAWEFVFN